MSSRPQMRYPSDLSNSQWSRLEPLLPPPRSLGRHRTVEPRAIANAINYRWETGCVWRMLPHDFPPWGTVYAYFRYWQRAGVIRQLREILLEPRAKSQPQRVPAAPQDGLRANSPLDRSASGRNPDDFQPLSFQQNNGFSPPRQDTERPSPTGSQPANLLD